jgi:DNA-binding SARP family transcriptional activator
MMLELETQTKWHLRLLGGAALHCPELSKDRLERKQAALLTILALDGAQTRSKLAGLLWTDSIEQTARNNLAQLLKRLKDFTGEPIVLGDTALRLVNTTTDALILEEQIFAGQYQTVMRTQGTLLAGYDFEDCPDFMEWLVAQRERLSQTMQQALVSYATELEAQQQFTIALEVSEKIRLQDNVSEASYRRIMRLQYALGNTKAALKTFALCHETLARELGVTPSKETLHLKTQIESHELPQNTPQKTDLPLSVLRPKHLIGREAAWAAMHHAWTENKAIFIAAAPGMGKSRLLQDFLGQFGDYTDFSSRSGDQYLPYSFFARTCKNLLNQYKPNLPDWVRLELSRVVPDLRQATDTLKPLESEADNLRFFQAAAETTRLACANGMRCIVVDDLQFTDNASFEISQFVMQQHWGVQTELQTIVSYRIGTLAPEIQASIEQAVAANLAVIIELEPFTLEQTQAFMTGLELNLNLEPHDLQTYTNGNPLYMLESIRYCLETGETLKQAPRIKQLITQRLENLPDKAMRLTQVAAILNQDFTLERAAKILEQPVFEIAATLEQLEVAQVMNGEAFVHDLIFESVNATIAVGIKRYLHRQTALILEQANLDDAIAIRVAEHYFQGQEDRKAIPWLWKAASYYHSLHKFIEAGQTYETIANTQFRLGDAREGCTALIWAAKNYFPLSQIESIKRVVELFFVHANSEDMRARAFGLQSFLFSAQGDLVAAEKSSVRGLIHAVNAQDLDVQQDLETGLGGFLYYQNKIKEAAIHFEASLEIGKRAYEKNQHLPPQELRNAQEQMAVSMGNVAAVNDHLGQHQKAEQYHREAVSLVRQIKMREHELSALSNLGINLQSQGKFRQSQQCFLQAKDILTEFSNQLAHGAAVMATLSSVEIVLGQYQSALEHAQLGLGIAEKSVPQRIGILQSRIGAALRQLGQSEQAFRLLETYLSRAKEVPAFYNMYLCEYANTLNSTNRSTLAVQAELTLLRDQTTSIKDAISIDIVLINLQEPEVAIATAQNVLKKAKSLKMNSVILTTNIRLAQTLLRLGQAKKALKLTTETLRSLEEIVSSIPMAEVMWTHYQAQAASKDANANTALEKALQLIQQQQSTLALEYQDSFFTHNPINKAILEAASALGIKKI